ncbi:MAG TPA: aconitate hydratase [Myxococcota bacterium]
MNTPAHSALPDPTAVSAAVARAIYATVAERLRIVRARLARPLTLSEKILFGHLDDAEGQELGRGERYLRLRPDRVVFQDVLGQTAMLQLMQTERERVAVPTSIHCDHLITAKTDASADVATSLSSDDEIYRFLRAAAARYGAGFWGPNAGIIHQVVLENYAFPGEMIIGTDSHTPNAGGLGAIAVGVGGADAVEVIAGLPWELLQPRAIAVVLTGKLGGWTAPKDVILHVAGILGVAGATNAIVEYIGPGARTLSATGKATITNMGAELGATTSVFPADDAMVRYLRATGRADLAPLVHAHMQDLFSPDEECEAHPELHYDRVLALDLSTLEPHVVGPHSPDRARPISQLAAEVRERENNFVDDISAALVGSCTNSSYEDMCRAADVAAQARAHGLTSRARFLITPGSERVRATVERDGQLQTLRELGGVVLANACGPCIGQWQRDEHKERDERDGSAPNTIVTSYNRNFRARNDGNAATMSFIASPEIVTALAIAGRLSFNPLTDELIGADGRAFKLAPPQPAPDVPARAFERGDAAYVAPPSTRGDDVGLRPDSERLRRLERWPAWDGNDLVAMPVLIKTKGKTTTDQISPAGPWLRWRGNLERFSDNLLSGAVNAFTGAVGVTTSDAMSGSVADVARGYRARGIAWVIVGDANYGEGSSREHAALSPRLLNGAAVIARSFARIHESNLKKQGMLALQFDNADDYDRVRARDRVSLLGLARLAPGKPVACALLHDDGTEERISLRHSYSASQLDWFRTGSALNAARASALVSIGCT